MNMVHNRYTVKTFAVFLREFSWQSGTRNFFSYDIFFHGSKCQFIDGINLNLTHVCVCCEIIFVFTYIALVVFIYKVKKKKKKSIKILPKMPPGTPGTPVFSQPHIVILQSSVNLQVPVIDHLVI